jgi:hypothetical protein
VNYAVIYKELGFVIQPPAKYHGGHEAGDMKSWFPVFIFVYTRLLC